MADETKFVIDPKTGDVHRATDILEALQEVLRKYGYALLHRPHAIVLGKMEPGKKLRAIAEIKELTPFLTEYREINWTPKAVTKQ